MDVTELKYRWVSRVRAWAGQPYGRSRPQEIPQTRCCVHYRPHPLSSLNPVLLPSSSSRYTDGAGRRGTARMLLGLGVPPGGRPCRELLQRINAQEGFYATDVSDMDLAQVLCLLCAVIMLWLRRSGCAVAGLGWAGLPELRSSAP